MAKQKCPKCNGTGTRFGGVCYTCHGRGYLGSDKPKAQPKKATASKTTTKPKKQKKPSVPKVTTRKSGTTGKRAPRDEKNMYRSGKTGKPKVSQYRTTKSSRRPKTRG